MPREAPVIRTARSMHRSCQDLSRLDVAAVGLARPHPLLLCECPRPYIGASRHVRRLLAQLHPALVAAVRQRPVLQRGLHRAPGLTVVRTVLEAAVLSQRAHIRERSSQSLPRLLQTDPPQPRSVDHHATSRQYDELTTY